MGLSNRQRRLRDMLLDSLMDIDFVEDDWLHEEPFYSVYIGSFLSLDPCGRYHHVLSPNGVTKNCMQFWESLDKVASQLGGWIESGEGDPLDQYFCLPEDKYKELSDKMMLKTGGY